MAEGLLRVALTGGIATGKSYCLRRFADLGVPTIDADLLARRAVDAGTPGLAAVVARFGSGVVLPDGALDRSALGRIVFADAAARRELERIVHPEVFRAVEAWFSALPRRAGTPTIGIADIPLLYETGSENRFDKVIVAACSSAQQLERVMARDGLSRDEAARRIASQLPIDQKRGRADYVIDTSGTLADTERQVEAILARLLE